MADETGTSPRPLPPTALSIEGLLDGISEGFVAFDTEWRIAYVNRSAAEYLSAFTATPAWGLVGRNLWETFPALAGSQIEESYLRAAAGSTVLDFEIWSPVSKRCIAYRAMPSPTGLTVFFRDITEQKCTIEALKASEARLRMASIGTLASGIAHEVNNPLAHVLLNLELIGEDLAAIALGSPSEALREVSRKVEEARAGADRVRKIVRAIEMFGRTDTPRVPIDVSAVLEMAVNLTANEIRHRAVLVKEYGATSRVVADESRLEQVFVNLLVNAAQAIPEGRAGSNEVGIKTWTNAEGRAVVEIRDTGVGVPGHLIERIFDPFFTTKDVGVGTGLGLSISHAIVTSFGGSLDVQSEVGKGTVFRVVLPGCAPVASEAPKAAADEVGAPKRRGRVLVIDDEEAMGLLLEHGLGKEHATTSLTSARDALEQLEAGERFDAILCDVMMPDLTGPEFYALVQRFAPEQAARIIFMTGAAFSSADWAFLETTAHPTLRKPFVLQAVRDVVRVVVG